MRKRLKEAQTTIVSIAWSEPYRIARKARPWILFCLPENCSPFRLYLCSLLLIVTQPVHCRYLGLCLSSKTGSTVTSRFFKRIKRALRGKEVVEDVGVMKDVSLRRWNFQTLRAHMHVCHRFYYDLASSLPDLASSVSFLWTYSVTLGHKQNQTPPPAPNRSVKWQMSGKLLPYAPKGARSQDGHLTH